MLPNVAKSCQKLPKVAKRCQKMPKDAKKCQKLPKVTKSYQKLQKHKVATHTRTHERTGGLLELLSQLIAGWLKRQSEPTRPGLTKTFCQTFKGKI